MACCMFAAFIVGHIVFMWRSIEARFFPRRAVVRAARLTASAWRPGMDSPAVDVRPVHGRLRFLARPVGFMLIVVSLAYFSVQAKDALEQARDARSFATLLAQNICRVRPEAAPQAPLQLATARPSTPLK